MNVDFIKKHFDNLVLVGEALLVKHPTGPIYVMKLVERNLPCEPLDHHIRTHPGEKPYMCNLCNKTFSGKGSMNAHRKTHSREKAYICSICNKSYAQLHHLNRHMMTHTGNKPYKCNLCYKAFSEKRLLNVHTNTHTGVKPFVCNICNKAFSQKTHLNIHRRLHTGERPYACNLCHKTFRRKDYLDVHTRIHTGEKPYKCNMCERAFADRSSLRHHKRLHTGEKPYTCSLCHKSFVHKYALNVHTRTHSGEKPYVCQLCNEAFAKNDKLKLHSQVHAGPRKYNSNLYQRAYSHRSLRSHMETHNKGVTEKDNILARIGPLKTPVKCRSLEKSGVQKSSVEEVGRNIVRYIDDGAELSTVEVNQIVRSSQRKKTSSVEQRLNSVRSKSRSTADVTHLLFRTYGCGVCDKIFNVEEVFMEHCHDHHSENPLKSNFEEFFDLHLLNYFP